MPPKTSSAGSGGGKKGGPRKSTARAKGLSSADELVALRFGQYRCDSRPLRALPASCVQLAVLPVQHDFGCQCCSVPHDSDSLSLRCRWQQFLCLLHPGPHIFVCNLSCVASSLDNLWNRNSPQGRMLFLLLPCQLALACLLLGAPDQNTSARPGYSL